MSDFELSRYDQIKVKLGTPYGAAAVSSADIYWLAAQVQNLKQWREQVQQQCVVFGVKFDEHHPRLTVSNLLQSQFEMGSTSQQMEIPLGSVEPMCDYLG